MGRNKIFLIIILILFISCASESESKRSFAIENGLVNICPHFGALDENDPIVQKSRFSNEETLGKGRQKYTVDYVIAKTPSGLNKEYLASHAFKAREIRKLDELRMFQKEFVELCPSSEMPKEFGQLETQLLAVHVKNCIGIKSQCLEQISFLSNSQKFEVVYPLIDQAVKYENKELFANFLLKSEFENESTFNVLEKMAMASEANKSLKRSVFFDYCSRANELDSKKFQSSDISKKYFQELEKEKQAKDLANSCSQNSKYIESLQLCLGGTTSRNSKDCQTTKKSDMWSGLCSNDYKVCYCQDNNLQNSINYCKKLDMRLPTAPELEKILQTQNLGISGLFWSYPKSKHPLSGDTGYMAIGKVQQLMYIKIDEGETSPLVLCVK